MQSENSVAFKVFVQRGKDAPEVRRFAIDKGVVASFEYLKAKLISVFPSIKNSPFTISWKDDEGDEVVISSDEELILALSSIQEDLKKLFVKANKPKSDEPPKEKPACFAAAGEFPVGFAVAGGMPPCFPPPGMAPCFQPPGGMPGCFPNHGGMVGCFPPQGPMPGCFGPPGEVPPNNAPSGGLKRPYDADKPHPGVVCDSCNGPIHGYRYKCVTCEDFDLCPICEGKNAHSEHFMIRIPVPIGPLGGRFSRVVGHKLLKSLRKAKASEAEAGAGECPFMSKRCRKEKCSGEEASPDCQMGDKHDRHDKGHHERGHHGGRAHHGGGRAHHGGRPDRHCGQRTNSWFNTFATYLNEFANLAGDLNPEVQKTSAPAAGTPNPSAPNATPTEANASANAPNGNGPNEIQMLHVKYLQNVGRTVAKILDPLGIDVDIEVRSKGNENVEKASENPGPSKDTPLQNNDVSDKGSAEQDAPIIDIDDSSSSSDESVASLSDHPGRADDWTMLNTDEPVKEKGNGTPSAASPKVHGFDMSQLTQEFSRQLELQMQAAAANCPAPFAASASSPPSAAAGSSAPPAGIYPFLPTPAVPSAPVPAPMQVDVQPPKIKTPKPVAPEPRPNHHVLEAFERMRAMGFKDDNGKLLRMLITNNGNISEVLDTLSQSIP